MRAALYIRVSTEDQTEYSPAAQKGALLSYAQKNGYTVSENHIYVDEGISGRKAQSRPAFMRMIRDAKSQKPFDIILVHKHDRFARSREDSVVYKSLLKKECNIRVVSITEQIEDDKFSVILEAMLEAMAEYYSLNLSEEVLKGMLERAKRGGYQARAPLGYRMKNKELVIDQTKEEIIRYIYSAYNNGISMADIAMYLNDMGISTVTGLPFKKRSVNYVINNATYAGYISFKTKKGDSVLVPGLHEKIIDEKLYSSVKDRLRNEKRISTRSSKQHKHFLSGLLYCSACNGPLVYNDAKCPFFQCIQYKKGLCSSHYVTAASIETIVLNALKQVFAYASAPEPIQSPTVALHNTSLVNVQTTLQRARLSYLNGIDTLEQYEQTKSELLNKIESITSQLKNSAPITLTHINELIQSENKENLSIIAQSVIDEIIYDKDLKTVEIILSTIH